MADEENRDQVLRTVQATDRDLSIKEISERTGLSRVTASKWVGILCREQELVKTREVGNAKFFDTPEGQADADNR